jgi:stress-induced morphogen
MSSSATKGSVGPIHAAIESKLASALSPSHLDVINESHMHSGPATESHFKVVVVSNEFEGKTLIARHRLVNDILKDELSGALHGEQLIRQPSATFFFAHLLVVLHLLGSFVHPE